MNERWSKSLNVLDAQPSSEDDTVTFRDGRTFTDVDVVTDDEGIERLREGRICWGCQEPQEVAMPERCSLCGFRIREEQPILFAKRYSDRPVKVGSRINWADEEERMKQLSEYEGRTGIAIPPHIRDNI